MKQPKKFRIPRKLKKEVIHCYVQSVHDVTPENIAYTASVLCTKRKKKTKAFARIASLYYREQRALYRKLVQEQLNNL